MRRRRGCSLFPYEMIRWGVPESEQGCSVSSTIEDLLETDLEQTDTIGAVSELLMDFAGAYD